MAAITRANVFPNSKAHLIQLRQPCFADLVLYSLFRIDIRGCQDHEFKNILFGVWHGKINDETDLFLLLLFFEVVFSFLDSVLVVEIFSKHHLHNGLLFLHGGHLLALDVGQSGFEFPHSLCGLHTSHLMAAGGTDCSKGRKSCPAAGAFMYFPVVHHFSFTIVPDVCACHSFPAVGAEFGAVGQLLPTMDTVGHPHVLLKNISSQKGRLVPYGIADVPDVTIEILADA